MTFLFPLRAEVAWATRFLLGAIYLDDTVEFAIAGKSPASTRIRREGKVLTPEIARVIASGCMVLLAMLVEVSREIDRLIMFP